jgi:hypothetical protein
MADGMSAERASSYRSVAASKRERQHCPQSKNLACCVLATATGVPNCLFRRAALRTCRSPISGTSNRVRLESSEL